jgi:hypothetical protein
MTRHWPRIPEFGAHKGQESSSELLLAGIISLTNESIMDGYESFQSFNSAVGYWSTVTSFRNLAVPNHHRFVDDSSSKQSKHLFCIEET